MVMSWPSTACTSDPSACCGLGARKASRRGGFFILSAGRSRTGPEPVAPEIEKASDRPADRRTPRLNHHRLLLRAGTEIQRRAGRSSATSILTLFRSDVERACPKQARSPGSGKKNAITSTTMIACSPIQGMGAPSRYPKLLEFLGRGRRAD